MKLPPKKVPKAWIRNRADELAIAQGMRFDAERGQFVCDWIEANCWLFEGKEEPVKLLTWHRDLLMRMFSWIRWSEFHQKWIRRFRVVTVFAAKKNAKSPLIAFIGLYMLYGDSERGPKICIAATKIEQAALAQKHAIKTVEKSPALAAVCKINKTNKAIICEARDGIMLPISNDKEGSHGINANCLCIDELHVIDADYAEILDGMTGYRAEPIIFRISTAGNDADSYGYKEYQQGKLDERNEKDPPLNKLFVDYSAPQDISKAELEKDFERYAKMANPGWGENVDPEIVRQRYDEAKDSPSKFAWWKQLYLNVWQLQAGNPLINPADWQACTFKGTKREFFKKFRDTTTVLGMDFSTLNDFTVACYIFKREDEQLGMFFQVFLPEATVPKLTRQKKEVQQWYDEGYILKGGNDQIEQAFIQREVVKVARKCFIRETIFDPTFAPQTVQQLTQGLTFKGETVVEGIGGRFYELRQHYGDLTRPIADFEALCVSHGFEVLHNPCVAWQMGNLQAKEDGYGGRRIEKTESWRKIDAGSAAIASVARALRPVGMPTISSV